MGATLGGLGGAPPSDLRYSTGVCPSPVELAQQPERLDGTIVVVTPHPRPAHAAWRLKDLGPPIAGAPRYGAASQGSAPTHRGAATP
jgi:hypothetical protein